MLDRIPYEILQLVASGLLPRIQCRMAITSRHCYKYLYTDLLRWHAHKAPIPVPKYRLIRADMASISEHCNKLICNEYIGITLWICDFTNCKSVTMDEYGILYHPDGQTIEILIRDYGIKAFDNYYRCMHRDIFKICASIRLSSLLSLPYKILRYIISISDNSYRYKLSGQIHDYILYYIRLKY